MVCLDPFLGEQSLQAAAVCVETGTPYVTIDVPPDSPVGKGAVVLIVSEEYRTREAGMGDRGEALAAYTEECPGLVILTDGAAQGDASIRRTEAVEASRRLGLEEPGHGQRAARYAELIRRDLPAMDDGTFELLHFACQGHTDYRHAQSFVKRHNGRWARQARNALRELPAT